MFSPVAPALAARPPFSIVLPFAISCALVACTGGGESPPSNGNHAPTAAAAHIVTDEDTPSAPVTPSVTDPDTGDSHSFTIVTSPMRGAAVVVGNQLVYTPDADYNGADVFTFEAKDGGGLSVIGTASVTVTAINDAPLATRAGLTALEETAGSPVTPYVEDPDIGDTFTYQIMSTPANGTAFIVNNQLVYTPDPGFTGTDSFSYQVTDSGSQTLTGTALVRVYSNASLARCTGPSVDNGDGTATRITAGPCAFYAETTTRTTASGDPVTVRYITHRPSDGGIPRGVVFLIAGGELNANITGDAATGAITTTGGNFLVRTAQLFADAGYIAIAMDRPSDRPSASPADPIENIDQYRTSVDHAIDIAAVLRQVNTDNLDVFLAGTSRGAISVVANNPLAAGILISSAVTSDNGLPNRLYVGDTDNPKLLPSYVQRPVHNLWHTDDGCIVSTPAGSQAWTDALIAAGASVASSIASGGFYVTSPFDPCGALSHHGFLGIEPTAVGVAAAALNDWMTALAGNHPPTTAMGKVQTRASTGKQIDLAALTRDADSDTLSYLLPYAATSLGGSVGLAGSIVSYTPPPGGVNQTDYFVYVATDGNGGVSAASVAVEIGS